MYQEHSRGVLISGYVAQIRLTRLSPKKEWGTTVLIDVKAGPFEGAVRDDSLVGIARFCEQLSRLHEQLVGDATLGSNEKLTLVMTGHRLGGISVRVDLYGEHIPLSKLSFEFDIDQSYLPTIIKQLREEFPEG
ncbi:MAG: WapI family immunity protein [Inquilinaceae bacterium]